MPEEIQYLLKEFYIRFYYMCQLFLDQIFDEVFYLSIFKNKTLALSSVCDEGSAQQIIVTYIGRKKG